MHFTELRKNDQNSPIKVPSTGGAGTITQHFTRTILTSQFFKGLPPGVRMELRAFGATMPESGIQYLWVREDNKKIVVEPLRFGYPPLSSDG